jgi:hypothetical protein
MNSQRAMPTNLVEKVIAESITKMQESKEENSGIVARRKK